MRLLVSSFHDYPDTLASPLWNRNDHIKDKVHVAAVCFVKLQVMSPEQGGQSNIELHIRQMLAKANPTPAAEGNQIVRKGTYSTRAFGIAKPPLGPKLEWLGEGFLVGMHVERIHTDNDTRWNLPVAVLPGVEAVDSWQPLDLPVGQT